jgi:hypothetical protein
MAAFRDISTINVGMFTDVFDFNLTTQCLHHFLDRGYKMCCSKMDRAPPSDIGSLLFFQVYL